MERQGGHEERDGDAGQDQSHPLVSLLLLLLSFSVRGETGIDLEEGQDLETDSSLLLYFCLCNHYLGVDHGQDDEGEEVLDEEDEDGEGVLHVAVWPDLYTHGVAGPGQGDPLQRLEHQHWRGDGEGDQPNREIDKSHFCMSHFSWKSVIDLSNGEPSINCYCSYSTG